MPKQKKSQSTAPRPGSLAARVQAAFDAARKGDLQPSAELAEAGRAVVPHVAPYVKDKSEDVRRQAVAVLAAVGGKGALAPLAQALTDPSARIQEAASIAIYDGYAPKDIPAEPTAGTALRRAARAGAASPAIPLLLSYFPGRATLSALEELRRRHPEGKTKFRPWSQLIPVSLPISVALSRLGDAQERKELLQAIETSDQAGLEFLLDVLREVDAPDVIHSLARLLDDQRAVEQRVPSGIEAKPRLCDVAVGALVRRLKLKVGFELNNAIQYAPNQIEAVRKAVRSAIPQ